MHENVALAETEYSAYSLDDARRDAAALHRLKRKAALSTAMIDQELAELQKDMQALEERRKEILDPIENEMQYLKVNLMEYHRRELDAGGDKTIKLPWATLKSKKQSQDYDRNDTALLEWVQANAPEFIKPVEPQVAWGDLKKAVVVAGDKVLLKETGELVSGLVPKEQAVKFDVEVL